MPTAPNHFADAHRHLTRRDPRLKGLIAHVGPCTLKPRRDAFRIYYRFLETDDEYFDSSPSHHRQGFWNIYGIYLPREVLEKVYYKNAERLLVGLKRPGA